MKDTAGIGVTFTGRGEGSRLVEATRCEDGAGNLELAGEGEGETARWGRVHEPGALARDGVTEVGEDVDGVVESEVEGGIAALEATSPGGVGCCTFRARGTYPGGAGDGERAFCMRKPEIAIEGELATEGESAAALAIRRGTRRIGWGEDTGWPCCANN